MAFCYFCCQAVSYYFSIDITAVKPFLGVEVLASYFVIYLLYCKKVSIYYIKGDKLRRLRNPDFAMCLPQSSTALTAQVWHVPVNPAHVLVSHAHELPSHAHLLMSHFACSSPPWS